MADTDDHQGNEEEFDPTVEPKSSRAWIRMIEEAEKAFEDWQDRCDNIDKLYASLDRLASVSRDRAFQLFWANVEVLKPAIYARPPVPVVVPKFKDRRPLYRTSSELLERCATVAFDIAKIDGVMRLIRDDVAVIARGVPWIRYETKAESGYEYEKVCIEHKDRKDFLHAPARNWNEVGWVAAASYLTRKEARERFYKHSGKAYQEAEYAIQREDKELGAADGRERAKFWELWSKDEEKVVWVAKGVEDLLDEGKPHLKLEGFFPCPRPAYGTVQRGSLVPVPDFLFYKDQLEEINELTARIHTLAEAVRVRGFYPAGAGEIGDAIETAIKSNDDRQIVVPISSWAAFGGVAPKDTIVWLPIDMIVTTIQSLVELRKLVIDDVYQIMGLSDIMRGATDPNETLGAQQLKSQYGSVRIRDKQSELVRVARDTLQVVAEIIAENFNKETMLAMSQMELPTNADIAKQVKALEAQANQIAMQVKQAQANPQIMAQAQANPEEAQKILAQAQEQIEGLGEQAQKLQDVPTIEKVHEFLRDQKTRAFVLDIETDSTIQPDEDAEKQRRGEFMTALGAVLPQLGLMVKEEPSSAEFAGELLKFATGPFRVGRGMEQALDTFVETMKGKSKQPQGPNPDQIKAQADAQAMQQKAVAEQQAHERDTAAKAAEQELKTKEAFANQERAELQHKASLDAMDREEARKQAQAQLVLDQTNAKHAQDMEKGALEIAKLTKEIERVTVQTDAAVATTQAKIDQTNTQTDNSIATTEAGVAATEAKTAAAGSNGAAKPARRANGSDGEVMSLLKDIQAYIKAPRSVVYGPDGKVAGVGVGDEVRPVVRSNGKITGMQ